MSEEALTGCRSQYAVSNHADSEHTSNYLSLNLSVGFKSMSTYKPTSLQEGNIIEGSVILLYRFSEATRTGSLNSELSVPHSKLRP